MKFSKNKTYQGLFLSDVHYLLNKKIKNHNHKELFHLLDHLRKRGVRFERICLVGDILESWYFSAARHFKRKQKRFHKLFDRLDALVTPTGEKFFIVGNHDTTSFTMKLPPDINAYLEKRNWKIRERVSTETFVALHGHQGQYSRLTWILSIAVVRALHGLASLVPNLFRVAENFYSKHLNRSDPSTVEEELEYYSRLSRVAHQHDRVLIAGHTHDFLCIENLKIVNTGDWVGSRTFVIQTKRSFLGIRMRGRKDFKKEFKLEYRVKKRKARNEPPEEEDTVEVERPQLRLAK